MLSKYHFAALLLAPVFAVATTLPARAAPRYTVTALPIGTTPAGINNAGQVVGDIETSAGREGFVWSNGNLVAFGAMGGAYASATAINNAGVAVGYAGLANGDVRSFQYSAGVVTALSVADSAYSFAAGINDLGQIAGQYFTPATGTRAFLYTDGMATDLGDLGGGFAAANALNNAGHVVGFSALDDGPYPAHAFLYADGVMRDLGAFPEASLSEASAINDSGQIAGFGWVRGSFHSFLYQNGMLNDLGTLGGRESFAYDINNLGQIVGYSDLAGDLAGAAYLYQDGVMTDLNSLIDPGSGWTLQQARGINDLGQIAGYGCRGDVCGGVLLRPAAAVPEPGSIALLLAALGSLGLRRAARRAVSVPRTA